MPHALSFPADLERIFREDTAADRIKELRLTITIGVIIFVLMAALDPILVEDIGWLGVAMRLLIAPILLYLVVNLSTLPYAVREWLIAITATVALLVMTSIAVLSISPYRSFMLFGVVITLIYIATTVPLRITQARVTTSIACGVLIFGTIWVTELDNSLKFAIVFHVLVVSIFSLIATYRIERSVRLNYLITAKEKLRLHDLTEDREKFAVLAQTDHLTGLANRAQWDLRCAELLQNPANNDLPVGLMMIDVDYSNATTITTDTTPAMPACAQSPIRWRMR